MRRDVALLVLVEPVQGEPSARHIVHPPSGLIAGLCRDRGPILQPVAQRRCGELTLVTVGYRGEEGVQAPEEPCKVHLRWLLRPRGYTDVEVRDTV